MPWAKFGTRWSGRQFDYVNCRKCGSKFITPLPSGDDLRRIYTQENYHDEHYADVLDAPQPALAILANYQSAGGALLDFGCGNGGFLRAAVKKGYCAEGVEVDAATRDRAAANSGCTVSSFDVITASARKYDIIHLGDVLEHLPDPISTMRTLESVLAPDGLFLIEGPLEDNRSIVAWTAAAVRYVKTALGRSNYADEPPTHLTRTTAASQRRFLGKELGAQICHFEVSEDGWPYRATPAERARGDAKSRISRMLIGQFAVGFAVAANVLNQEVGNRFIAVTKPIGAS